MTDHVKREEREALIAGDRADALTPDEAAELGLLAELLADPSTWAVPSPGLEDSIVRALCEEPAPRPARTPVAPPARRRPSRRQRFTVAAFGAAAALIAVIGGVIAVSGGGTSADYDAQLTATALAPGAHASATISKSDAGFRVTLHAHGLGHRSRGEYYAAWLKNRAGTVVPIGTFSSSDGTVTLWSGVSPADYRTISVTVQPANSSAATSGRRVLVGPIRAR